MVNYELLWKKEFKERFAIYILLIEESIIEVENCKLFSLNVVKLRLRSNDSVKF